MTAEAISGLLSYSPKDEVSSSAGWEWISGHGANGRPKIHDQLDEEPTYDQLEVSTGTR